MTTTAGQERRRVGRHPIRGVEGTLRAPGDVKVLDVGLFGLAVQAAGELPVGETLCLELRHGNARVNVEVEVRWTSVSQVVRDRGRLLPLSTAGVEFRDIYREGDSGIWEWIAVPDAAAPGAGGPAD